MSIWAIAVLAIFGSLLVLSTLHQLTLSEHVTVMCILPFFTAFVAKLWLGEIFTKVQAMCCCTSSNLLFLLR
jgi:drug/metabolite transporter (DMT)-like permease